MGPTKLDLGVLPSAALVMKSEWERGEWSKVGLRVRANEEGAGGGSSKRPPPWGMVIWQSGGEV